MGMFVTLLVITGGAVTYFVKEFRAIRRFNEGTAAIYQRAAARSRNTASRWRSAADTYADRGDIALCITALNAAQASEGAAVALEQAASLVRGEKAARA